MAQDEVKVSKFLFHLAMSRPRNCLALTANHLKHLLQLSDIGHHRHTRQHQAAFCAKTSCKTTSRVICIPGFRRNACEMPLSIENQPNPPLKPLVMTFVLVNRAKTLETLQHNMTSYNQNCTCSEMMNTHLSTEESGLLKNVPFFDHWKLMLLRNQQQGTNKDVGYWGVEKIGGGVKK